MVKKDIKDSTNITERAIVSRQFRTGLFYAVAVGLIILMFSVHLKCASFGVPHPCAYSSDEYDVISRSVKMLTGDLLPIHASKPTAYNLAVAGMAGMDYVGQHFLNGMTTAQFEREFFLNGYRFTHLARLISVFACMGTMLLILWGVRRCGRGIMLSAPLFYAMLPQTFHYSHWAKEDAFCAFWVTAAFIAAAELWQIFSSASQRRLLTILGISAFCAGMAVSTKYNALPVVLFPLTAAVRLLLKRRTPPVMTGAVALFPIVGAFFIGTPFALLHPLEFVHRSLSSPVAKQAAGGFLYVHNMGKTDLSFLVRLLWSENVLWVFAAPVLLIGILLRAASRFKTQCPESDMMYPLWVPYVLVYTAILGLSFQLDYQYVLILSPILLFALLLAIHSLLQIRTGRTIARLGILGMTLCIAWSSLPTLFHFQKAAFAPARQTQEGQSLSANFDLLVAPENRNKPLLIVSPFFFRYWPWIPLTPESYRHLRDQARANGADGGWFERAAKWAETDTERKFSAEFLEIKTAFTMAPDGTRTFEPQPFSLNPADYADKYSLIVIPQTTTEMVHKDIPEMKPFRDFVNGLIRRFPEMQEWRTQKDTGNQNPPDIRTKVLNATALPSRSTDL